MSFEATLLKTQTKKDNVMLLFLYLSGSCLLYVKS